jgi:urease accessory protein
MIGRLSVHERFGATRRPVPRLLAILLAASLASPALAHAGHGPAATLAMGLAHPFGGLDHLMAMIGIGIWAGQQGGRATWAVPLAFVAAVIGGFAFGMAGGVVPVAETLVVLSVAGIALAIMRRLQPGLPLALAMAAGFGIAHGYVHSVEAPAGNVAGYALGFTLATALLHAAGIALARALPRLGRGASGAD